MGTASRLGLAVACALAAVPPAPAQPADVAARDAAGRAIARIAGQLDAHPLVMVGELYRSREIHAFLQRMLRDPAFVCRLDDVVVEFGNARLQAVADAYVSGKGVSEPQLRSVWRETLPPLTWNSPVYREFYETVREVNGRRLCGHPIRVPLGDPPIDWSKVTTAAEFARFDDRDRYYAGVVEREVLAKGRRALLVAGELHAMKRPPDSLRGAPDEAETAEILEQRHPGALFSIVTVPLPEGAAALGMGAPPSFRAVRGSELERADFQLADWDSTVTRATVGGRETWRVQPAKHWPRMGEVVDGLLHLGGNHSIAAPAEIYLDPAYQEEFRRRARIIRSYSGQDFMPAIDGLVRQAVELDRARRR